MGFHPKADPHDEALESQTQFGLGLMLPPKERATPLNWPRWIRKSRICKEESGLEATSREGQLSVKEQQKLVGVNGSLVAAETKHPPVATKDEAMLDMGFQVLPHDSPHAVTGNQN